MPAIATIIANILRILIRVVLHYWPTVLIIFAIIEILQRISILEQRKKFQDAETAINELEAIERDLHEKESSHQQ